MNTTLPKLLAISSPGGHWIQLTRLCQGLEGRYHIVYAMPGDLFGTASTLKGKKVYSVTDVSADDKWKLIPCALQVLYVLLKERPQAILSTGAAPGFVAVWLGSLLGIRTIWVDSIANVKQISRAGRLAQKRADVFLTQWEHLSNGQDILFKGAVL
ncbi:MAG TPA: oligosaccharide biosynthesis protein Alg14 [Candidatus Thiothrix moscowensis]|uniref:oligosaccharide biosynthesis protein Alg14 n=1 Tax=unclassified Thiothrix TaxID=2636184 RepID=UPI001A20852F|nr:MULTISPECIES: oligosaccharide biosynthesis protein Alg14 [unclassified Thiothrix]MBJ6610049.1 oligosaccharide biosynthesis protein Alg14 [Candidatus Thiothrix moscowensis]HRJ54340.1 oligosaccharide biosynthesis protein Alg14 [Candidatus Thiothrix moscowensis]HRJ94585.1 oligosaccharide biosynthesis protein Alg14 [Candidatus Thiothrix moscowensis]